MCSHPGRPVGIALHFSKHKIPGPEVVRHLVVPLCSAPCPARLCSSAVRVSGRQTAKPAPDTAREDWRLVFCSGFRSFHVLSAEVPPLLRSMIGGTDCHSTRLPIRMYNVYAAKDFSLYYTDLIMKRRC